MNPAGRDGVFPLGRFRFACGQELEEAHLTYRVLGEPAADGSNLVLVPTAYGGWPEDFDWLLGPIVDPGRWCLVVVSQSLPASGGLGLRQCGVLCGEGLAAPLSTPWSPQPGGDAGHLAGM